MVNKVTIHTDIILLGQFLKFTKIISNGGEEKIYLSTHQVKVNGELENRRGKKLHDKDIIEVEGKVFQICTSLK